MHIILFVVFSIFSLQVSGQKATGVSNEGSHPERYLQWEPEKPLQWENFKGEPEHTDRVHGAVTYAGIDLQIEKIHLLSGEITVKAAAIFDQGQSWVRAGKKDPELLAHEQLHFDIAELYARQLEKKINSLRLTKQDRAVIKKWQHHYSKVQLTRQKSYDHETLHGIRKEEQQSWRREIDRQLRQYESDLVRSRLALEK